MRANCPVDWISGTETIAEMGGLTVDSVIPKTIPSKTATAIAILPGGSASSTETL